MEIQPATELLVLSQDIRLFPKNEQISYFLNNLLQPIQISKSPIATRSQIICTVPSPSNNIQPLLVPCTNFNIISPFYRVVISLDFSQRVIKSDELFNQVIKNFIKTFQILNPSLNYCNTKQPINILTYLTILIQRTEKETDCECLVQGLNLKNIDPNSVLELLLKRIKKKRNKYTNKEKGILKNQPNFFSSPTNQHLENYAFALILLPQKRLPSIILIQGTPIHVDESYYVYDNILMQINRQNINFTIIQSNPRLDSNDLEICKYSCEVTQGNFLEGEWGEKEFQRSVFYKTINFRKYLILFENSRYIYGSSLNSENDIGNENNKSNKNKINNAKLKIKKKNKNEINKNEMNKNEIHKKRNEKKKKKEKEKEKENEEENEKEKEKEKNQNNNNSNTNLMNEIKLNKFDLKNNNELNFFHNLLLKKIKENKKINIQELLKLKNINLIEDYPIGIDLISLIHGRIKKGFQLYYFFLQYIQKKNNEFEQELCIVLRYNLDLSTVIYYCLTQHQTVQMESNEKEFFCKPLNSIINVQILTKKISTNFDYSSYFSIVKLNENSKDFVRRILMVDTDI
ncbi:prion-like- q/n-rich -domain-bearing protein [Anaeramoeba flamelloides]|uniref:Prion-like- q/n-rich -domain-bearing protein n=1 Tax=Anaeramoeba flamelloides TaxID=1746091 RepID=A0AAV8A1Z8_9EUKA|nr:prion-like- q/n-rich -domain-bearing protein [Anaeramoeba flamelloides]